MDNVSRKLTSTFRITMFLEYYNRQYKYKLVKHKYRLVKNDISYSKQFVFQLNHFTKHTIIQLLDQLLVSFEENKFTLDISIDF